jgi:hypothetical protein
MANIYVKSTTGNNGNSGASWALAKATLAGAQAIAAAGDFVWVSQAHAESTASTVTLNWPGAIGTPTTICCVDDSAAPPTTLATTATVGVTGSSDLAINGNIEVWGITFLSTTGSSAASLTLAGTNLNVQNYYNCNFEIRTTFASTVLRVGGSAGDTTCNFYNVNVKFAATTQTMSIAGTSDIFRWYGGAMTAGSSTPNPLINGSTVAGVTVLLDGVDLSGFASTLNIMQAPTRGSTSTIQNCKLPASWSGSPATGTIAQNTRVSMYNCDNAATNYRVWIQDFAGVIKQSASIYRNGGYTANGATSMSWEFTSNGNANPHYPLYGDWMSLLYSTTGASKTDTVEFIRDNATALKDSEIWLDLIYQGNASYPISSRITDQVASPVATAANQATSTATWTGTGGFSNPTKQAMAVTMTPNMAGLLRARVAVAKASTTIYVDPYETVA